MVTESLDKPPLSFRPHTKEILNDESTINRVFEFSFSPDEYKAIKRQISLLKRRNNEIHPVSDNLVEIASNVRKQMGRFVVGSFLEYARETGVFSNSNSVFSDNLPEDSVNGLEEFFKQSYRDESGIPRRLWDNRWLCAMSNGLKQAQSTGTLWVKNRLIIAKDGVLRYSYHLDTSRKDYFPKGMDLTVEAMEETYPSKGKISLVENGEKRGLLTHATQIRSLREILSSGFLAPYRHIRPLSLSEGVVSLPYSEKVIIFDPDILKQAGFALMRYDEDPIDAEEILEVREPLPIPIFLASGIYDTTMFNPERAKKNVHIWSLDEPTAAFGNNELLTLRAKINEAQRVRIQ